MSLRSSAFNASAFNTVPVNAAFSSSSSQSGGGNSYTPVYFQPNNLSGLFLWFKSTGNASNNQLSLASGAYITYWQDLSGSGNNLTPSASSTTYCPTFKPNALNGYPSIVFNGVNYLSVANNPTLNLAPSSLCLFTVFKPYNYILDQGQYICSIDNINNLVNNQCFIIQVENTLSGWSFQWGKSTGHSINTLQAVSSNTNIGQNLDELNVYTLRMDGWPAEGGPFEFGKFGAIVATGIANMNSTTYNSFNMGYSLYNDYGFHGEIIEVVGYNRPLYSYEINEVNNYLIQKYQFGNSMPINLYINGTANSVAQNNTTLYMNATPKVTGNIPLYVSNAPKASSVFPLYISAAQTGHLFTTLYINSANKASGNLPLYTLSTTKASSVIPFYTTSVFTGSKYIPLYLQTNTQISSGNSLYIHGLIKPSSNISLYTQSSLFDNYNIPLYIGKSLVASGGTNLYMTADYITNNVLNLFTLSTTHISGGISLYTGSSSQKSGAISIYITGVGFEYNKLNLYTQAAFQHNSFSLFTNGIANSYSTNLFVHGVAIAPTAFSPFNLFTNGVNYPKVNNSTNLFTQASTIGTNGVNNKTNLYMYSIGAENGVSLFMEGPPENKNPGVAATLYISAPVPTGSIIFSTPLFVENLTQVANGNRVKMFTQGLGMMNGASIANTPFSLYIDKLPGNNMNLFINGVVKPQNQLNLFTKSAYEGTGYINLYVGGRGASGYMPMYVSAQNVVNNGINMFAEGFPSGFASTSMYVRGF